MSDTPLVTATVTPEPRPEDVSVPRMVALARDVALDMFDLPILLKKHELTPGQYETLKNLPYFKNLVEHLALEWHGTKNAQQRLAVQTAVGLEEVLPTVIGRAKIANEPLQGVAQLVKVLADICGATANARQATTGPTERFKITINLGADTEVYNKSKPVVVIENAAGPDAEASPGLEDQSFASGASALLALQTEPEKT